MPRVTIIDYGIGNLLSVRRAFEYCGAEVILTDSPELIEKAEHLVLPGVGAFADGMAGLRQRSLIEPIRRYAKENRPFMGICLGMQMMLEIGEEYGTHEGLGLIKGKVSKIPDTGVDGIAHKIPHIGWNSLAPSSDWDETILDGINPGEAVYFVHSFTAMPLDDNRLADCYYSGRVISAAIRSGNLYGCQFHPEKSGQIGLKIVDNFIRIHTSGFRK
ncbi:imidazole glycerol phosphate synthase subunit HisH [Anaeroselena agilis]|uniref:Imidazole glycerol phosphate synthase subunit HisH n=1 Tax=Anaeroselena agilis TaxID=3063788 RepID=A0ABU3P496_9FIRM|nr:imidazole glycerol phosphate synthase subunit HisH [Selenomonadales bacterium 4137-cl]